VQEAESGRLGAFSLFILHFHWLSPVYLSSSNDKCKMNNEQ
jgi:hypothetical protein